MKIFWTTVQMQTFSLKGLNISTETCEPLKCRKDLTSVPLKDYRQRHHY